MPREEMLMLRQDNMMTEEDSILMSRDSGLVRKEMRGCQKQWDLEHMTQIELMVRQCQPFSLQIEY